MYELYCLFDYIIVRLYLQHTSIQNRKYGSDAMPVKMLNGADTRNRTEISWLGTRRNSRYTIPAWSG